MSKCIVGYYVRRTVKSPPHRGQTLYAESHRIYPTREKAETAMQVATDDRYTYDVAEVWMHVDDFNDSHSASTAGGGE